MEAKAKTDIDHGLNDPEASPPPPVPGGSYSVESLGRLWDNFMGDARQRAKAEREVPDGPDPATPEDPEPIEPPPLVEGGNEPHTRGADPGEDGSRIRAPERES